MLHALRLCDNQIYRLQKAGRIILAMFPWAGSLLRIDGCEDDEANLSGPTWNEVSKWSKSKLASVTPGM